MRITGTVGPEQDDAAMTVLAGSGVAVRFWLPARWRSMPLPRWQGKGGMFVRDMRGVVIADINQPGADSLGIDLH